MQRLITISHIVNFYADSMQKLIASLTGYNNKLASLIAMLAHETGLSEHTVFGIIYQDHTNTACVTD